MGCSDVKVTAAHNYTENMGWDSQSGEQTWRLEGFNEYCSPEIWHLMKLFQEDDCGR